MLHLEVSKVYSLCFVDFRQFDVVVVDFRQNKKATFNSMKVACFVSIQQDLSCEFIL